VHGSPSPQPTPADPVDIRPYRPAAVDLGVPRAAGAAGRSPRQSRPPTDAPTQVDPSSVVPAMLLTISQVTTAGPHDYVGIRKRIQSASVGSVVTSQVTTADTNDYNRIRERVR
jgi:hypothetical protein